MEKDCDELRATNEDLLSRQKMMAEDAFSLIMTEVWSVDPELEVPRVQKFVNKATILKTIAERKKSSHARLGTPSGSLGYPTCFSRCLPQMPLLRLLIFWVPRSPLLIALWRRMLGMAFPPRCSLLTVPLFFGSIHILLFGPCFFLFGSSGYFILLGLLFCYDTITSSTLVLCMLVILQMNA